MTTVTLKMPAALATRLQLAAERLHTSRSDIIRRAVADYIDHEMVSAEQPIALDLVRDFVGKVEGPPDLSTHPRHLQGYGR